MPASVRIGCSGWNYAHWRERVYPRGLPPRRWLERYAELFDTVEVNFTFYRLPGRDAVAGWAAGTPPDFLFTVKVSRYLTHVRRLREVGDGMRRLFERIEPLVDADKLGPLLWQLPENFHRDDERLASALAALPPCRHAFEFRHASWFADPVYDLLRAHGAALVIGDHPRRTFQRHVFTAPWTLVRLHYGRRGRKGNYSRRELEDWAARIADWRREHDVYVYFNNDWEAFAVKNGLLMQKLLAAS